MADTITAELARQLVAAAESTPADWLDLRSWTAGYCDGYDARDATTAPAWMWRLAEDLAQLDRTTWVEAGQLSRERRIAREVAHDRHRPVRFDDPDWPPVAVPGSPSIRLGGTA